MSNAPKRSTEVQSEPRRRTQQDDPFDVLDSESSQNRGKAPRQAQPQRRQPPPEPKRQRSGFGLGVLVFIGTLLGSLIGIAADAGGAADTIERFQSQFYPELCVAGSNTILGEGIPMAEEWAAQFQDERQVRVRIDGVGSVRGVENAISGQCVHVLAMSEPMTPSQYSALRGADIEIDCAAEIGYDVVAFVTDIDNKLPALLERSLSGILNGQITNWQVVGGEPGEIRVLARPGSGTTEVILNNVARWRDDNISDDQYFPPNTNYIPCPSNNACLDATLATPGSLYWVSTAWMRTQPEQFLRVMPILRGDERPINPLTETVDLDEYPSSLIRPLYFYVLESDTIPDDREALAREFLYYVRSVRGQTILENHSFYAFFKRPRGVNVTLPPGYEPDETGLRPTCLS